MNTLQQDRGHAKRPRSRFFYSSAPIFQTHDFDQKNNQFLEYPAPLPLPIMHIFESIAENNLQLLDDNFVYPFSMAEIFRERFSLLFSNLKF